jgi:arylsulfatase A-like enzyme
VTKVVFSDNTKSWSGDHCVDPRLVPGVFWSTAKIHTDKPRLLDMAPTVLDIFGVPVPGYMQGRSLFGPRAPAKVAPQSKPAVEAVAK